MFKTQALCFCHHADHFQSLTYCRAMFSPACSIFVLCFIGEVFASTIITTYRNRDCTDLLDSITGAENGLCQENTLGSYGSFSVASVDTSCVGMLRTRLTRK